MTRFRGGYDAFGLFSGAAMTRFGAAMTHSENRRGGYDALRGGHDALSVLGHSGWTIDLDLKRHSAIGLRSGLPNCLGELWHRRWVVNAARFFTELDG